MSEGKPSFAVVGHPNKGKSSIVSTLSFDDTVNISSRSGTTEKSSEFLVEIEGYSYLLIDTPGFQRPHRVLEWLQQKASSAEMRSDAVSDFVKDPECQINYPDEVELLRPLVNGAAILYVVDGSRPYGKEYEAEMEILRWSGQPSMALINPIENERYVESWENALQQYFKVVRVFNPMAAEFSQQIDLLQAFAHLDQSWAEQITQVTSALITNRDLQKDISATILARLVDDLCFYKVSQKVFNKEQAVVIESALESKYIKWMAKREQLAISELLVNYKHFKTQLSIDDFSIPPDLFDYEQWYMWGLSKQQLAVVSALTGAAAGLAIDIAMAGTSLMIGVQMDRVVGDILNAIIDKGVICGPAGPDVVRFLPALIVTKEQVDHVVSIFDSVLGEL